MRYHLQSPEKYLLALLMPPDSHRAYFDAHRSRDQDSTFQIVEIYDRVDIDESEDEVCEGG